MNELEKLRQLVRDLALENVFDYDPSTIESLEEVKARGRAYVSAQFPGEFPAGWAPKATPGGAHAQA